MRRLLPRQELLGVCLVAVGLLATGCDDGTLDGPFGDDGGSARRDAPSQGDAGSGDDGSAAIDSASSPDSAQRIDGSTGSDAIGTVGEYIADHTIATETVLRSIPVSAINAAKDSLHILYVGTSHSQQVMEGMAGLAQYKPGDDTLFAFTHDGNPVAGTLDIHYRGASGTDLSNDSVDQNGHTGYFRGTVAYLDNLDHADVNVVMWSWCSIEGHAVQVYLDNFEELIDMYKVGGSKGRTAANEVTFVFMSGYARGSDADDPQATNSPYNNAVAIRRYCETNHHFMLDYWSQDVHDYGTGAYKPTESGNANVQHWQYCSDHAVDVDWYECRNWASGTVDYPAHTDDNPTYAQHLTGNRRAYAAWWIWARLAGWDGTPE